MTTTSPALPAVTSILPRSVKTSSVTAPSAGSFRSKVNRCAAAVAGSATSTMHVTKASAGLINVGLRCNHHTKKLQPKMRSSAQASPLVVGLIPSGIYWLIIPLAATVRA
jgi:hypothetical protein